MNWLKKMFQKGSEATVEGLRNSVIELRLLQKAVLLDSFEYKRMQKDWKPIQQEIEKGETTESLQALNEKYKQAISNLEKSFKTNSIKQSEVIKGLQNQIKSSPTLLSLLFYEDFIPEEKYNELAVSLVKAHKEGKINDNQLKKLTKYKKKQVKEDEAVYVKDNRTQYADTIIIDDENKILFTVRNKNDDFCPGTYCLPGGHIEDGETPREAARRELMEETGIELEAHEFNLCGEYLDDKSHIYYFCVRSNQEPVVLEEREQQQWEKVTWDEIDKKPLIMNLAENLKNLIAIPKELVNPLADNAQKLYFDGNKIKKGIENLVSLRKLDETCALVKANGEIVVFSQENDGFDVFEKASRVKLVPKKVFVTRGSSTYLTTVWVNPLTGEVKEKPGAETTEVRWIGADVMVGDEIEVFTRRGKREGIVKCCVKTKEGAYIGLITPDGKYTEAYLKSLTGLRVKTKSYDVIPSSIGDMEPESLDDERDIKSVDFSSLPRLGGTSETFLYDNGTRKFFIKKEREGKPGQLQSETMADAVYRALGYPAPQSVVHDVTDSVTGEAFTCKIYPYLEVGEVFGGTRGDVRENAKQEIRKGFALDCLLANWDVIGADGDNILCGPTGIMVWRLDNGSAFQFRAKGSLKPGDAFLDSSTVVELDSMRNSDKATSIVKEVYGSLTDEEICTQIHKLQSQWSDLSLTLLQNGASEEVKKAVRRRLDYMVKWAEAKEMVAKEASEWDEAPSDPDMPSLVTEKYFENWDSFELKGNAELKDALKKQILKREKERESGYKKAAEQMGMTVGQYKAKLQKLAEDFCEALTPGITIWADDSRKAFYEVFKKGGRWKSLFETLDGCGSTSRTARAEYEEAAFGFPYDIEKNKEMRPIYGYATNQKNGDYGTETGASGYGNVFCQIDRKKALESATVTCGDSLGHEDWMVPVPLAKPHFTMFQDLHYDKSTSERIINSIEEFTKGKKVRVAGQGAYFELQYHDQLSAKDVDTIHFKIGKNGRVNRQINKIVNSLLELASGGEEAVKCKVDFEYKDYD